MIRSHTRYPIAPQKPKIAPQIWRSWGLIPRLFACKANTLPTELHPHMKKNCQSILFPPPYYSYRLYYGCICFNNQSKYAFRIKLGPQQQLSPRGPYPIHIQDTCSYQKFLSEFNVTIFIQNQNQNGHQYHFPCVMITFQIL